MSPKCRLFGGMRKRVLPLSGCRKTRRLKRLRAKLMSRGARFSDGRATRISPPKQPRFGFDSLPTFGENSFQHQQRHRFLIQRRRCERGLFIVHFPFVAYSGAAPTACRSISLSLPGCVRAVAPSGWPCTHHTRTWPGRGHRRCTDRQRVERRGVCDTPARTGTEARPPRAALPCALVPN